MCFKQKVSQPEVEDIKVATQADASVQKSNVENRTGVKAVISDNIKTSNVGLDDVVETSKKKLLGE